jgi:hypothetical protein
MTLGTIAEEILHQAKRRNGSLVTAFWRNVDNGFWDCLVVAADLSPLYFWEEPEGVPLADGDTDRDERGRVRMVVTATPPGTEPAGLIPRPVASNGSPQGTLVAIVQAKGLTMLERPQPAQSKQQMEDAFSGLIGRSAAQRDGNYFIAKVETADGDSADVLVNWLGEPLLFWVDTPDTDPSRHLLAQVVVLPGREGMIAMGVDEELRPIHSGDWYRQHR